MPTEKFRHKIGTKTVVLTRLRNLPFGVIRTLRKASTEDQVFGLLEAAADEKNLAILDTLDSEQVGEIYRAWEKDSDITTGESSASPS